jgi:hypothetical protein
MNIHPPERAITKKKRKIVYCPLAPTVLQSPGDAKGNPAMP